MKIDNSAKEFRQWPAQLCILPCYLRWADFFIFLILFMTLNDLTMSYCHMYQQLQCDFRSREFVEQVVNFNKALLKVLVLIVTSVCPYFISCGLCFSPPTSVVIHISTQTLWRAMQSARVNGTHVTIDAVITLYCGRMCTWACAWSTVISLLISLAHLSACIRSDLHLYGWHTLSALTLGLAVSLAPSIRHRAKNK